jgi:hypothetical protein
MVYGDWLSERGDPWGQRIAERHTEWPPRLARLFPPEIVHPEWEYGHVYGLTMTRLSVVEHVELLALALFSRPAEFLVELTIERAVDPTVLPQLRRLLGAAARAAEGEPRAAKGRALPLAPLSLHAAGGVLSGKAQRQRQGAMLTRSPS